MTFKANNKNNRSNLKKKSTVKYKNEKSFSGGKPPKHARKQKVNRK